MPRDDEGNYVSYAQIAAGLATGTYGLTRAAKRAVGAGAAASLGARKLLKQEESKIIKRSLRANHELKFFDLGISSTSGASAIIIPINIISQGATAVNRTGRKVMLEYIDVTLIMYGNVVAGSDSSQFRTMLIWDKETRGTSTAIGEILQFPGSAATQLTSPPNGDNLQRFKWLYDSGPQVIMDYGARVNTGVAGTEVPYQATKTLRRRFRVNRRVDFFNTNVGNIGDIDAGAVYLTVQSAGGDVFYSGHTRCAFRDI